MTLTWLIEMLTFVTLFAGACNGLASFLERLSKK